MTLNYDIVENNLGFSRGIEENALTTYIHRRIVTMSFLKGAIIGQCEHRKQNQYIITLTADTHSAYKLSRIIVKTQKCYHPAFILIECVNDHFKLLYEMLSWTECPEYVYFER